MDPSVREGAVEVVEQVPLIGEAVEHADDPQRAQVLGTGPLDEDRDVARFELLDDLLPRVGDDDDDEAEVPDLAIERRSDDVEDGWVVPIGAELERTTEGPCRP